MTEPSLSPPMPSKKVPFEAFEGSEGPCSEQDFCCPLTKLLHTAESCNRGQRLLWNCKLARQSMEVKDFCETAILQDNQWRSKTFVKLQSCKTINGGQRLSWNCKLARQSMEVKVFRETANLQDNQWRLKSLEKLQTCKTINGGQRPLWNCKLARQSYRKTCSVNSCYLHFAYLE